MQITLQRFAIPRVLYLTIIVICIAVLTANYYGEDALTLTTNVLYIPISVALVVLPTIHALRFRGRGTHGKAWIMFSIFASFWLIAQLQYEYDLIYHHLDSYPFTMRFFSHLGYAFFFLFSYFYIKPVEKAISKKMKVVAFVVSMGLLLPTIYLTQFYNQSETSGEITELAINPMLDAIVMFPAVLGVMLFFGGKVSFLWSITSLAILLTVIADTSLLISAIPDDYHFARNPLDMLYLWSYVLLVFGVYSQMKIFKHRKMNYYENLEDLR